MSETRAVPVEKFGRDHWSTLMYIETRAVDFRGIVDLEKMRTDPERHPEYMTALKVMASSGKKYPTRLAGGVDLPNHDDWDCVDDMEAAGFLVSIGTGTRPAYKLTDSGWAVASRLRQRRAAGNFTYDGFAW